VLALVATSDKVGIDAPFGWPDAFTAFLVAHQAGDVPVPAGLSGKQWRRELALRHTDKTIFEETGITPLSVAADKIGHVAMRCAGLLAKLSAAGTPVQRDGSGNVTEVYPAASLKQRLRSRPRMISAACPMIAHPQRTPTRTDRRIGARRRGVPRSFRRVQIARFCV
jgi:hypothetical protein